MAPKGINSSSNNNNNGHSSGADSCDESFNNNNNVNNNNSVFSSGQVSRDEQKSSTKVPDVDNFLQEAASHPADCGYAMELPQWFDLDKFKRGQDFMQRNTFTLFESKLYGLLSLLAVPSILRVLCMTKQSGDCCSAFNRYYSTISHMFTWYEGDPLEPGSKLYQSLKQIRTRHMLAAKKSKKSGLGLMSQYDMIVTQFGFFGFAFLHPRYFALTQEKRENWEGLLHFWRTIGYLLGIEDRFNLCTGTLEETRKICQAIQNKVLVPGLKDPPPQFEHMSRVLVNGMQCMIPALHYEVLRTIIFEDLLGFAFLCQMSLYGKFMLALYRFVHYQLLTIKWLAAVFRPYFNSQVRLAAYITAHFPFIAYWRYGKSSIHYH